MRKRKRNSDNITKRFYQTLKYLKKKKLFNGYLCTWQDELSGRLRFAILPGLLEAVGRLWKPEEVPFVVELLYTADTICYRNQMRNLVGMSIGIFDDMKSIEDCVELGDISLAITPSSLMTLAIRFDLAVELKPSNAALLCKIDWSYYERVKKIVPELQGQNWKRYYKQIVEPIAVGIAKDGAKSPLFWNDSAEGILECLEWDADLDREVVGFLVEDAWEYVDGGDCSNYNPLWLFGVEHYAEVARQLREAVIGM